MNREEKEEAIKTLENIKKGLYPWYPDEVVDEAIHALKQEPCEDAISRQAVLNAIAANCIWENEYNLTSSRIKNAVEQLPSVSVAEKTAIDAIENEQMKIMRSDWTIDQAKFSAMSEIRELIAELPPVSTEKTGHWIDKDDKSAVCSCCNRNNTLYGDFCKWCGAKMEVEE